MNRLLLSMSLYTNSVLLQPSSFVKADRLRECAACYGLSGMEKVLGIGGMFFRASDPAALSRWYEEHLGVTRIPSTYEEQPWRQEAGPTAFAPFEKDSHYFGDASRMWMINFRVRDLDAMAAQLRSAGIAVVIDSQTYPNGRFARLHDPEGNPIELWEPERGE